DGDSLQGFGRDVRNDKFCRVALSVRLKRDGRQGHENCGRQSAAKGRNRRQLAGLRLVFPSSLLRVTSELTFESSEHSVRCDEGFNRAHAEERKLKKSAIRAADACTGMSEGHLAAAHKSVINNQYALRGGRLRG